MTEITETILKASITAFNQTAAVTSLFAVPLFLVRVAYLNVSGGQASDYTTLIKHLALYFLLIFGFEEILKLLLMLPEHFAPSFSFSASKSSNAADPNANALSLVPNVLTWCLESLVAVLYYAATTLYFAVTVLMSALAPIVFLLGCVLGIGLGIRMFFGLLVMASAWPVVFSACDALHSIVPQGSSSGLSGLVFELVVTFFKLAGPLAAAFFSLSSHSGQAVIATMTAGLTTAGFVANHSESFHRGLTGQPHRGYQPRSLAQYGRQSTHAIAHRTGQGLRSLHSRTANGSSGPASRNSSLNSEITQTNQTRNSNSSVNSSDRTTSVSSSHQGTNYTSFQNGTLSSKSSQRDQVPTTTTSYQRSPNGGLSQEMSQARSLQPGKSPPVHQDVQNRSGEGRRVDGLNNESRRDLRREIENRIERD